MSDSPRQKLLEMLAERSFRLGEFRLSSGGTTDYYIDCRATTLSAEGARLTARVFMDQLFLQQWKPQAIGGMTLGADPIVVAVSMLSAQEMQPRSRRTSHEEYWVVNGFLVRKGEKSHGTAQRIEGFSQPQSRVVIVDDVCTTGASTIQAIEAARAAGMEVMGVLCLVEREEAGGRAHVEAAAAPAKFISIFTANDVRQEHLKRGQLSHSVPAEG
ncbi:MAG TPA: orotate phosphoribosyltransferase [Terriglobales bacterium]|jgi:orotate phosphoribosyltransferase|nr:orotate phosphoribosyltransferase [Terriglobales bacterium]